MTKNHINLNLIEIFQLFEDLLFVETSPLMGGYVYVLTIITYHPKYLDEFLTVLLETFTTGLVFARQLKQGVTTLCFNKCHPVPLELCVRLLYQQVCLLRGVCLPMTLWRCKSPSERTNTVEIITLPHYLAGSYKNNWTERGRPSLAPPWSDNGL